MEAMQTLRAHLDKRPLELQQQRSRGTKIIGYAPGGYMPEDMISAAGAVPVPILQGGSHEAVAESGAYLPRFLDTFCRAQIGHYKLGEDPLYQMLDLLIVPITDNNLRAIAEAFSFYTDIETFRFGVPHDKEEDACAYYLDWLRMLKDKLEEATGNKLDEAKLREQIALSNRMWELLKNISELRKFPTPLISGKDFALLNHASFYADKAVFVECIEAIHKELTKATAYEEMKDGQTANSKPRIMVTGSTLANGDYKVLDLVEKSGGTVVVEEFAEGMRHYWERVSLNGDILEALVDRYFRRRVPPAWFRPSRERIDFVLKLAKDYAVDGVIWYNLMYRDGYDIQSYYFEKILGKETGLKMLRITSDYDTSEIVPLRTRVEAFVETIRKR